MSTFTTLLAFIAAVGLLVTVHELGHYLVARWANVKILRFSIGFGRPLWLTRRGPDQTEWVIAAVPLGGYVRMLDERDPEARPEDLPRSFNRQPVGKRIAIVLAGPAANFLMAWLLYWTLFVWGTPGIRPFVAAPPAASAAAAAGLQDFDLVHSVGGNPVTNWQDLRWLLLKEAVTGGTVSLETENVRGERYQRQLSMAGLSKDDLDKDFLIKLGLRVYRPPLDAVIGRVEPGWPGAAAGIEPGDRIRSAAGRPIAHWEELVAVIAAHAGKPLALGIQRGGREFDLQVTPAPATDAAGKPIGRVGIMPQPYPPEVIDKLSTTVRHGPIDSAGRAAHKVWDMSWFSLQMLGRMLTGDVSWRNLSGPITIADYAGQSARLGVLPFLTFLALVSVSIGVLNLLPIPVLDGGQLVYYLVEILRGSPVSQRAVEVGQQIGLALLLGLTAFAFYNDIHRLITG